MYCIKCIVCSQLTCTVCILLISTYATYARKEYVRIRMGLRILQKIGLTAYMLIAQVLDISIAIAPEMVNDT